LLEFVGVDDSSETEIGHDLSPPQIITGT
jgi:hypothetical protein